MANKFSKGIYRAHGSVPLEASPAAPPEVPLEKPSKNDELLILLILFILLAASPALGLERRYFFIIILAVIGLGGVDKAFGLKG